MPEIDGLVVELGLLQPALAHLVHEIGIGDVHASDADKVELATPLAPLGAFQNRPKPRQTALFQIQPRIDFRPANQLGRLSSIEIIRRAFGPRRTAVTGMKQPERTVAQAAMDMAAP